MSRKWWKMVSDTISKNCKVLQKNTTTPERGWFVWVRSKNFSKEQVFGLRNQMKRVGISARKEHVDVLSLVTEKVNQHIYNTPVVNTVKYTYPQKHTGQQIFNLRKKKYHLKRGLTPFPYTPWRIWKRYQVPFQVSTFYINWYDGTHGRCRKQIGQRWS